MPVGDLAKFVYGWTIHWSMLLLYALLQNPLGCIGVVCNLHLHRYFNFTGSLVETVPKFVTPFVRVGTYPTRNFATLGPL